MKKFPKGVTVKHRNSIKSPATKKHRRHKKALIYIAILIGALYFIIK
jgi:hypothetical protein